MDERFKRKPLFIGLGAMAIIFLCIVLCGFGAMVTAFAGRTAQPPIYAPAPIAEEGAAPPPASYGHNTGPMGVGRHGTMGPFGFILGGIGMIFKLAFSGLLLLLLLGLVKRILWGPSHWGHHHRHWPPKGKVWKHGPPPRWGPWAWHCHAEREDAANQPAGEEDKAESDDFVYNGPQE